VTGEHHCYLETGYDKEEILLKAYEKAKSVKALGITRIEVLEEEAEEFAYPFSLSLDDNRPADHVGITQEIAAQ
jgi:hypothetical protein